MSAAFLFVLCSDPNDQAKADTSHCAHLLSLVACRSASTTSHSAWMVLRAAAIYSFEYSLSISMLQCGTWFRFWAIAWSQFVRFFVNCDWMTVSVAVSISQTTIKYVQNYFFSQFVFGCCLCVDVRSCSPTNSCWIAFYWVPLLFSVCVLFLQRQTASLCRPRCNEHEQKGNRDLFRARTPFKR